MDEADILGKSCEICAPIMNRMGNGEQTLALGCALNVILAGLVNSQ
jgi:hypothetical protein